MSSIEILWSASKDERERSGHRIARVRARVGPEGADGRGGEHAGEQRWPMPSPVSGSSRSGGVADEEGGGPALSTISSIRDGWAKPGAGNSGRESRAREHLPDVGALEGGRPERLHVLDLVDLAARSDPAIARRRRALDPEPDVGPPVRKREHDQA